MYSLIKKILFQFDPERAHTLTLNCLQFFYRCGLLHFFPKISAKPCTIMGIHFNNPIGLAAGLDKNGDYIDALAALGFGFVEIGTVTPKPQTGNPRPRLFRLTQHEAIINRMGFNNKGVEYVAKRLAQTHYRGVLGINIGKNKDTANENAVNDYLICFRRLWKFASYITINISSPNTPGLRDLQQSSALRDLLFALKKEQKIIADTQNKYVPLVVKISPDLSMTELHELAPVLLEQQIDGVIATNTTISRANTQSSHFANESGGLSGKPLQILSTEIIKNLHALLQNRIPIIGVGGIMDAQSAQAKIAAGASLLQLYTGLIYYGPALLKEIANAIK